MNHHFIQLTSLSLALLMTALGGCSAFVPSNQRLKVAVTPSDATLTINGKHYTSPAELDVMRNRDVSIYVQKEGYLPYQRTVGHHMNAVGALDIVGTIVFLVPAIGLFTPGAWSLDDTDVNVSLRKQ